MLRERTRAGLATALDDARKVALAQALYADPRHSIAGICTTLRVSRSILYRYITAERRPPADSSATRPDLEAGPNQT